MSGGLLEVRDLVTSFRTQRGLVRAVDGVSLALGPSSTLGVVGESGCGKSVTFLSVMRLVRWPGRIDSGQVWFAGQELLGLPEREMRAKRGSQIAMIFQEPMTSLNPVYTVGQHLEEAIRQHRRVSRAEARERALGLLDLVGIAAPAQRLEAYPHQLSGGMRQRVMIAIALCCEPRLLIADEPTTALDVTIQAQILALLERLQCELGTSVVLITHDLGVVASFAAEIIVMYAARVVERASALELFDAPLHPYTRGLLTSVPGLAANRGRRRLPTIAGAVPSLGRLSAGCRFRPRCPDAIEVCGQLDPPLRPLGPRWVACHLFSGDK